MARRCCCGDTCEPTRTYYDASDWTTGTGGSVTSDGSGGLDIDGPVDPSSFMSSEAYLIEFELIAGSVEFTFGSDTIAFAHAAKTVTANLQSTLYGRAGYDHHASPNTIVYLRVTPTHIFAMAYCPFGNDNRISPSDDLPQWAHGALVIERDGSPPPTSFSVEWTSASVTGFEISDSKVTYEGSYIGLNCYTPPTIHCPYYVIKEYSKNHKYADDPDFDLDLAMPDITVTGFEFYNFEPFSGDLMTRLTNIQATWGSAGVPKTVSNSTDAATDWAQAAGFISCDVDTFPAAWYEHTSTGNVYLRESLRGSYLTASIELDMGSPTALEPYPVPEYVAELTAGYEYTFSCSEGGIGYNYRMFCDAEGSLAIDVNDLDSGFTISLSGDLYVDVGTGSPILVNSSFSIEELCTDPANCCLVNNPTPNHTPGTVLYSLNNAVGLFDPINIAWTV